MGSPFTVCVSHSVEIILSSHHTQNLPASCLAKYEVFLLSSPYLTFPDATYLLLLPYFLFQMITALMTVLH